MCLRAIRLCLMISMVVRERRARRNAQHEHHTRCLALCRCADGDSFLTSGKDRSLLRRSALLDVVGATGARLLQQGTWYRLRHTREHRCFWCERVWCSLLQPSARCGHKSAPVLFYAPLVRRNRWSVGGHWFECHTNFQHWGGSDDDRCAVDFFLDGGDVYLLARGGKKSDLFLVLAGYGSANRAGVSLQIYKCVRIDFGVTRAGTRAAATTGIQTPRRVLADRGVRSLHDSADCVERAARLDHAGAFALARESRPRFRISSSGGTLISRS